MRVLWLAEVLRDAGLTVVEWPGWKSRGWSDWLPEFGVVHATAAARTSLDDTQVGIVATGRADLQGPIANAVVGRDGRWYVVASGRCNTTLPGTAGRYAGRGNTSALGVEACNDNRGEPWTSAQYHAYVRGWAAICRRMGWDATRLVGHKEHTPGRKTDPSFPMDEFRSDVREILQKGTTMATTDPNSAGDNALVTMILDGKSPTGVETVDGGKPRVVLYRVLSEILHAAQDDGDVTVQMPAEVVADLKATLVDAIRSEQDSRVGRELLADALQAQATALNAAAAALRTP